jgi:hypothetical protein
MSRTFRLRHLPANVGRTKKFTNASHSRVRRLLDDRADYEIAHVLNNFPCLDSSHWYYRGHGRCYSPYLSSSESSHLSEALIESYGGYPVGNLSYNKSIPFAYAAGHPKKEWRTTANRRMRRRSRALTRLIQCSEYSTDNYDDNDCCRGWSDFEGDFPTKKEYMNWWDLL